ncbi:MAG: nucleotidyl transferase AbiEii/AbiGii toxin family protein [Thaumarchaeota archaeon]|nr:nucleotidyl transferase AbiEii/AbiGii toxin family protein [Nitrososphaerota archaeon]
MIELRFQSILNKKSIEKIGIEYGFKDLLLVEKFIMNFEILTHIQKVLSDCVVKGGMAVPFHLFDKNLQRLSVDIDIVTGKSRGEVIEAMKQVSVNLKDVVKIKDPHKPKGNLNKNLPLLTYFCNYNSSIVDDAKLKIEIFYGNNTQIQSKQIHSETEIIGFSVDFPISVYDHGSLIGDKLTTLPFKTIGIDSKRKLDVPKQIHDIAALLKNPPRELKLELIFDTFKHTVHDEISYFSNTTLTFQQILDDLHIFSESILMIDNQIKLNRSYRGRFENFATEFLGNNRYQSYQHVTDILLIKTFIELMLKRFNGINMEVIAEKAKEIFDGFFELSQLKDEDKISKSKKIVSKYGKKTEEGEIMKNLFPEQTYLYDKLFEIKQM